MDLATYARHTGTTPAAFRKKLEDEYGLTLTHEAVRRWFKGKQPDAQTVPAILAATDGRVTREHLRPTDYKVPKKRKARAA